MTWTPTTLNIKDAAGTSQPVIAYTDGTNFSFAHPLLDGAGLLFDPTPKPYSGAAIARPADTTQYAVGDLVADTTTAGSVTPHTIQAAKETDQAFAITGGKIIKSTTVTTNANFRVHLFNAVPTVANGDNGAISFPKAGYLGSLDCNIKQAASDGVIIHGTPTKGTPIIGTPVSGSKNVRALIEALGVYIPGNAETFQIDLEVA